MRYLAILLALSFALVPMEAKTRNSSSPHVKMQQVSSKKSRKAPRSRKAKRASRREHSSAN